MQTQSTQIRPPVPTVLGVLLILAGIVTTYVSLEAQALWWFGTRTAGTVEDCYYAGGADTGGWTVAYTFVAATGTETRHLRGTAGTLRPKTAGESIPVVYLPWAPSVSNTQAEVALGCLLGPVVVFPMGLVLLGLGTGTLWLGWNRRRAGRAAGA